MSVSISATASAIWCLLLATCVFLIITCVRGKFPFNSPAYRSVLAKRSLPTVTMTIRAGLFSAQDLIVSRKHGRSRPAVGMITVTSLGGT